MKILTPSFKRAARHAALVATAVLSVVAGSGRAWAADRETERPRELAESTQEVFNKVSDAMQAQKWDEIIPPLQALMKKVKPQSYDMAMASIILASAHLQRNQPGDFAAAIPLLETTVSLGYHEKSRLLEFTFLLAQLYYNQNNVEKAEELAKRWLDTTDKLQADKITFYGSIVLQRAQENEKNVDKKKVQEALAIVERGLATFANPPEQLYQLKAVAFQLLDKMNDSAELFELMVEKFPNKKEYWQQLWGIYVNTGKLLRAIITLDRAQKLGFLNSQTENQSRVALYYNLQRYDQVAKLLEAGMANGSLENNPTNYELLAAAYQQQFLELKAVDAYKRAAEKFPEVGGKYDVSITNIYWGLKMKKEALEYLERGLKKGKLDKPAKLYMFAAYISYELKDFERGLELLETAEPLIGDDTQTRTEFGGLKQSIIDAAERERAQQAAS